MMERPILLKGAIQGPPAWRSMWPMAGQRQSPATRSSKVRHRRITNWSITAKRAYGTRAIACSCRATTSRAPARLTRPQSTTRIAYRRVYRTIITQASRRSWTRPPALSMSKLRRAVAEVMDMESVGNNGLTTAISFLRGANEVAKTESFLKKPDIGSLGIGKLIGILLNAAETAYWKFRLRPLHAEKKAYLEMS